MVIRRTISFSLTGFLILFIFIGSYHSFCECYAQTCPIHAQAKPLNSLWVLQPSTIADIDQPHVLSYLSLYEEGTVFSTAFITPLRSRTPPHETFLQIIASRYPG